MPWVEKHTCPFQKCSPLSSSVCKRCFSQKGIQLRKRVTESSASHSRMTWLVWYSLIWDEVVWSFRMLLLVKPDHSSEARCRNHIAWSMQRQLHENKGKRSRAKPWSMHWIYQGAPAAIFCALPCWSPKKGTAKGHGLGFRVAIL